MTTTPRSSNNILDVAQAQAEPEVSANGAADDDGREAVSVIKGISLLHFSRRLSTNLTLPQVGIDGASSHSGRRSLITNLASKGVGVRVLMSLAGHSNISTTQAYIDVNDEMQRAAIELVSGSTREAALVQYPSVFELSAIQSSLTF